MVIITILFIVNCLITGFPAKDQTAAVGQLLLDLYIFAALLMLIPERWRKGARVVGYIVMYALCIMESFLVMRFNMRIGPSMIMLGMDTTGNESKEFLELCLNSPELLQVMLTYLGILVLQTAFNTKAITKRIKKTRYIRETGKFAGELGVAIVILTSVISIPTWVCRQCDIFSFMTLSSSRTAERYSEETFYSAPQRLLWAIKFYWLMQEEADEIMHNMQNMSIEGCDYKCPRIVLIIGESYSKYHSALYGYHYNTTPNQFNMLKEGRLVIMDDVVSPWNLTSNVFKDIMSTHSCNEEGNWTDGILFPALFKKSGYTVVFLSNQFYANTQQTNCDVSGSFFLNRSDMNELCFNHRSSKHFTTDGIFLEQELKPYKHNPHELVIIHLYGQHTNYKDRHAFVESTIPFKTEHYLNNGLSQDNRQTLADYDNATMYNDFIIQDIYNEFKNEDAILIYLSDHGENIFDGGSKKFGRTHESEVTKMMAKYEFEVPMTIFFTDSFKINHPDVVEVAFANRHKPFATDDLPHLLLGLAGIRSSYYSAKHDIFSPEYDASRKRLLKGTTDYDALMKKDN